VTVAAHRAEYAYTAADDLFGGKYNFVSAEHAPQLQGTLTLLDNEKQDAGFLCVPGSHRNFEEWSNDSPDHSRFHAMAQRVPVREGSLIVWDVRLAHGSAPDQSPQGCETRPRLVQFVTLRTAQLLGEEQAERRTVLVRRRYEAHGIEGPNNPVARAVAGLSTR
jgi:ectoine hydroxylase-related dioxygenase (phytanoyl-CoA dioxygenase family)